MKKLASIIIPLLLINAIGSVFIHVPAVAQPTVIYVDDDNTLGPWNGTFEYPYRNITDALIYALQGDTIFVCNGTYYENLVIGKSLSLVGQNKYGTIVDGNLTGNVIEILADNVNITSFTVQKSAATSEFSSIYIPSSNNNCINNTIIKDSYNGIRLYDSVNNVLVGNIVPNNFYGIAISSSSANTIANNNISENIETGLRISDSKNLTVSNNNISKSDFGILFLSSNSNRIETNRIFLNKYGAYLFNSAENTFLDNAISANIDFGVWLSQSTKNQLAENDIFANERFGIYIDKSLSNTILKNRISANNQFGIRLDYSNTNILSMNTLSENLVRATILYYSNSNVIFHNNFISDNKSLASINSTNFLDNSMEGNYWSEYNGTDENQDGIGDTSHIIDVNNKDDYPLMGMFSDFTVTYENVEHHVVTISNSTISSVQFNGTVRMLKFTVTGASNTNGFCRIVIPERLTLSPYTVLVDGEQINASTLSPSNITHTLLYFTYNHSTSEVRIFSKSYFELLEKYDALLENFQSLNVTYSQLQYEYLALNQTYQQLLEDYGLLNQTYWALLVNYTQLQSDYALLLANNTSLQEQLVNLTQSFIDLQTEYELLQASYNNISSLYELLQNDYALLQNNYTNLEIRLNDTQTKYENLSDDFDLLLAEYESANQTYHQTLTEYNNLQDSYDSLNLTHSVLMADHTELESNYSSIQTQYTNLLYQYNSLNAAYNRLQSEYATARMVLWVVSIFAAVVIGMAASLTTKYHRRYKEQRRLAEKYKGELERISLLDTARTQFEADVRRRREKLDRFEKKYSVAVRPRSTLEDVIKSLELKKKTEEL